MARRSIYETKNHFRKTSVAGLILSTLAAVAAVVLAILVARAGA